MTGCTATCVASWCSNRRDPDVSHTPHTTHPDFRPAVRRLRGMSPPDIADTARRAAAVLRHEHELRCFVDGTRNLGHQSASMNTARLIAVRSGFTGTLTFVYANYRRPLLGDARAKLRLLGGLSSRDGERPSIRWMELGAARRLPAARFGFTGGSDDLSVNHAQVLNVNWFVRLQPFLWDDPPAARHAPLYTCSRIECRDHRFIYPADGYRHFRRLWMPRADASNPAPMSRRDHDIEARIERALAPNALLWPVYGLQHFGRHARSIVKILARVGQQIHAARGQPVRLVSFSPRTAHLPATEWLHRCTAGVTLLDCGPVGPSLYRRILATSALPPIVEGQESVNQLLDMARPFLQIRRPDRTAGFELRDMAGSRSMALALDGLSRGLATAKPGGKLRIELIDPLYEFAQRCLDHDRALLAFFAALKPAHGPDKLDVALASLMLALEAPRWNQNS